MVVRDGVRAGLLALTSLVVGCSSATQLIVVVESDLSVPGEMDAVQLTITGPLGQPFDSTQSLTDSGAPSLPLTLGVRPAGEALGPLEVRARGLLAGGVVVERVARTSLVRGDTRTLVLFLSRDCRGVTCPGGQTCTELGCASADVPSDELPPWPGHVPTDGGLHVDAARADAGVGDAATPDAGPTPCTAGSDCDDGIDCTSDICTDGACTNRSDDGLCTAQSGGTCDVHNGCQYPSCSPDTCSAGPCQTASCDGDQCVRTNLCSTAEMCCAGECVAAGCDDGNPCTDDTCGTSGCEHTNNTGSCDDGVYCNGADTCADGSCSAHVGSPCSGAAVCDESMERCTGCLSDSDCGAAVHGTWSGCGGFGGTCDTSGTKTRDVTTYTCDAGTCTPSTTTESQSCTRVTNGSSCGDASYGAWSTCEYPDTCAEAGTHMRTRTDYVCMGGSCVSQLAAETDSCAGRTTDGTTCGTTSCGSWGSCSTPDVCSTVGTKTRTCTAYACIGGGCVGMDTSDSTTCTIPTDGRPCDD